MSATKLSALSGVSPSTTAKYISTWTHLGYVLPSHDKPRLSVYQLTFKGAKFARAQQVPLNRRDIILLAAFRSDTEFGSDLAARARFTLRYAADVFRRLVARGFVERSRVRVRRPGIGSATHTYTLTPEGSMLCRDPRIRIEHQRQDRVYDQAIRAIRAALLTVNPLNVGLATLVTRTRLSRAMIASILADHVAAGLVSARLISAPSYTAARGTHFYALTIEGLKVLRQGEETNPPRTR